MIERILLFSASLAAGIILHRLSYYWTLRRFGTPYRNIVRYMIGVSAIGVLSLASLRFAKTASELVICQLVIIAGMGIGVWLGYKTDTGMRARIANLQEHMTEVGRMLQFSTRKA